MESEWKTNAEISPNCPRCGSSNTKFCYYNNYSLTQPRYFCKGCRRYWTKGGSLRNVPVGGSCRKNRRSNKNLRESIDSLTFKNSPCNNPIEYSYDPRRTSCSSSSVVSTCGPNIDLALVYANFLNQKPDSRAEVENQDQVHAVFDPSIENSRLCNKQIGPSSMLPEELALSACFNLPEHSCTGSHFCDGNSPIYFRGFNSMKIHHEARIEQCNNHHDAISFELPPLPGEEEVSHDMMWTNSEIMVNNAFQATQSPLFGPNSHDDANLLMGNWSPFNLPRDASFPKP